MIRAFGRGLVPLAVLLSGAPAFAQRIVESADVAEVQKAFADDSSAARLRCRFSPLHPALNFAFRFEAGYRIDVPLQQFHGTGHSLTIDTRVTPDGRDPVYLTKTEQLPAVPTAKVDGETSGAFVVGEGAYRVEVLLQDDQQRSCRSAWRIQAELSVAERQLTARTAPNAVEELSASAPPPAGQGLRIPRLTVLLHAAAMAPNSSKLQPDDIDKLADSLSSLLEDLPANAVRLEVFNLDQRAVLLRKDPFTAAEIGNLRADLEKLQLATVDYRALQRPGKPIDLLAGLIEAEFRDPQPPDALIVLGPRPRLANGLPSAAPDARPEAFPIFYLEYQIAWRRPAAGPIFEPMNPRMGDPGVMIDRPIRTVMPASPPDPVERLINGLKGETIPVRSPHDLAAALRRMDGRIARTAAPVETAAAVHSDKTVAVPAAPPSAVTTEPTGGENPIDVLARLRDRILPHARKIPDYTCVEAVRRDRYEPVDGRAAQSCETLLARRKAPDFSNRLKLDSTDWLHLDVAMTTNREIYSWAGDKKFAEGDIDEVVQQGAIGTGPFAGLLIGTFESRDRTFIFEGETEYHGRRVFEYSFEVPEDRSAYRVKAGKDWVITGYRGALLVDPQTAELVRLSVLTDELPEETATCEADTFLEYDLVPLGERNYLLPKVTHQRFIGRDGTEADNTLTFSSCREYQAESTLLFGTGQPGGARQARPAAGMELPAGLPVSVELLTAIRAGASAAGDRLEGRLAKPIVDARQRTLVPAGTPVEGRIVRVETRYTPRLETTVAFHWESIRIAGAAQPLSLRPNRQPPGSRVAGGRGQLQQRGVPIELPLPGEGQDAVVHLIGERVAIASGSLSEWFTAPPK